MLRISVNVVIKEVIDFSQEKCISEDNKEPRIKA